MASFAPLWPVDGCLPLEDDGLIGDGSTAALVGRNGAIPRLCVPRVEVRPQGGARAEPWGGGLRLRCLLRPALDLQLSSTVPLDGL
jgi:hypothetical protein